MSGLAEAPLTPGDAAIVTAVWQACEIHDDGAPDFEEADVVAFGQRPSFDFARHTLGVRDAGQLVAFGILILPRIIFVHVLPDHRGRGIGTRLLAWSEEAARAAGMDAAAQEVSDNDGVGIALLRGARLRAGVGLVDVRDRAGARAAGAGAPRRLRDPRVRPRAGRPRRLRHDPARVREWPDYVGSPFEDWSATTLDRPGFVPELLSVLMRGDEVAGTLLLVEAGEEGEEGWIDQVAVAREHRGHGLGRALLMHAFGQTWRRGGRICALGTDSRTGARGLYEHVGMHMRKSYGEYRKAL